MGRLRRSKKIKPVAADRIRDDTSQSFIDVLKRIDGDAGSDGMSVANIIDRLDERAFGLLILLLTIPCLAPGLPGAQLIAVPIFLLAVQMLFGRNEPWLPGVFMRARIKKSWIASVAAFADKRLNWTGRLARPRWRPLASGLGERIAALFMALAAITIMLPITNTIPSLALLLLALGIIERDGVFTTLGALVATAWLSALAALIVAILMGSGIAANFLAENAPWLAPRLGAEPPF